MDYYHKYIKYKTKYMNNKKMNNKFNMNIQIISNIMSLDTYITIYFKTYNLISWNIDKLYSIPENDEKIKNYCNTHSLNLLDCNPPYKSLLITNTLDDCCKFKGIGISKRSIHKFYTGSLIVKENINFKFIKHYQPIATQNYKTTLYNFLRSIIIENIPKMNLETFNKIKEILQEYDVEDVHNIDKIKEIINSDDFYGLDEILNVIFPNKEFESDSKYVELKKLSDANLQIKSIQYNDNKLFEQIIENKKIYFFYFSYGTLKNIEFVDWQESLKPYISDIKNLLNDESIEHIILAGHSVGSITIQYLAMYLINENIDIRKIYIIGTGCITNKVLDDTQLNIFKEQFQNRYCFIINSFMENDKVYYDSITELNKINTHIIICYGSEPNENIFKCSSATFDILNYSEVINSGNFIPKYNTILHEFITYSNMFLQNT